MNRYKAIPVDPHVNVAAFKKDVKWELNKKSKYTLWLQKALFWCLNKLGCKVVYDIMRGQMDFIEINQEPLFEPMRNAIYEFQKRNREHPTKIYMSYEFCAELTHNLPDDYYMRDLSMGTFMGVSVWCTPNIKGYLIV